MLIVLLWSVLCIVVIYYEYCVCCLIAVACGYCLLVGLLWCGFLVCWFECARGGTGVLLFVLAGLVSCCGLRLVLAC